MEKWLDDCQRLPSVNLSDSVDKNGFASVSRKLLSSMSKASPHLMVRVKKAKIEKALASLNLQKLKKKIDLQQRSVVLQHEKELLEVKSEIGQACLKRVQILEKEEGFEECYDCSYDTPSAASVSIKVQLS